jgi:hypothetical protein
MGRLLVAAILLAALAGTAAAQAERASLRGQCNSKSVDIYYWPQGHPAVPAIGFPAFGPAHVEFYKGHDVANAGQLGYMDVARSALSPTQCTAVADKPFLIPAGTATQTAASTQKLRCTALANAEIRIGPWTQVKQRVVTRLVKIKGKKRKVRRVVRTTVTLGNLGSVGATGTTPAVAEVRLSNPPGKSSLKWDPRACVAVDVGG